MRTTIKARRITLEDSALTAVEAIMAAMRKEGEHLKPPPSKLVSWILCCFYERYFEKEKPRLIEAHQDKRAVLINMIRQLTEGDNEKQIDTMLKIVKQKAERGTPSPEAEGVKNQGATPLEPTQSLTGT